MGWGGLRNMNRKRGPVEAAFHERWLQARRNIAASAVGARYERQPRKAGNNRWDREAKDISVVQAAMWLEIVINAVANVTGFSRAAITGEDGNRKRGAEVQARSLCWYVAWRRFGLKIKQLQIAGAGVHTIYRGLTTAKALVAEDRDFSAAAVKVNDLVTIALGGTTGIAGIEPSPPLASAGESPQVQD